MIKPKWVVIDKDFLQQADQNKLNEIIGGGSRLLLTARTAYEIDTTSESGVKQKCFKMLNVFEANVDIVEEDGADGLLGYEIQKRMPSSDVLQDYIRRLPTNLEQYLQSNNPSQWEEHFEKGPAENFRNIVSEINKIYSLNKDGLKDRNTVQDIYAKLTRQIRTLPSAESIDERWIIFRILQVDGWMVLNRAKVNDQNRLHDRIDSRIAAVALLTKGLATNDRLIKNIFGFFCPTGRLYSGNL